MSAQSTLKGLASINPATGEMMREFEPHSEQEVERRLERAVAAFREHRRLPVEERARLMTKAGLGLDSEKNQFARLMTLEMGKPLRAAIQEVEKCALACRYYAEHAARFLADEPGEAGATRSYVRYQPLGPVLAVMPWNFPFWQVFRFAAPGLMAGNVGLLKHASNVPQCALAIEAVFRRAGFAEGAFQALLVGPSGSAPSSRTRASGRSHSPAALVQARVWPLRPARRSRRPCSSSAAATRSSSCPARTWTGRWPVPSRRGRSTTGNPASRPNASSVHEAIADEFERRFVRGMAALKVGDPMDEATDIGPLATAEVLETLAEQVDRTVGLGAQVLLGGKRLDRPGFFFAPTVLKNIPPGSPAHREELFGPVASLFRAPNMEEAIRLANDTGFGLGASAWTNDQAEREMFIERIESGLAFVNAMVASDPRLPFGGVKQSGYGRELGVLGLREFVNIKTVCVFP